MNSYKTFELLYDKYAPKALGFITRYTNTKEQAEELLVNVFLEVWNEINKYEDCSEKIILKILLIKCRPLFKMSNSKQVLNNENISRSY
jgi:hypothetical protein